MNLNERRKTNGRIVEDSWIACCDSRLVNFKRRLLIAVFFFIELGCAPTVRSIEYVSVPPEWKHERPECAPLDEILLMSNGQKVVILQCPDGEFIGVDLRTGRVIK